MEEHLVDPNFLAVIQSLKPYMPERALQCTEIVETLLQLLSTEEARVVREKFQSLRQEYKAQKKKKSLEGD